MPQDSEQKYFQPMSDKIVAVCVGGFVCPIAPYQLTEDELRELNDD